MTTALEGGEGSASRSGRSLLQGKSRYPLYKRLGGPQGRSGQVWKSSPLPGFLSPDRPARSQPLYRLSYQAHTLNIYQSKTLQKEVAWRTVKHNFYTTHASFSGGKKDYSFCLMVEASDHGYVLHTRSKHVTRYRIRYDMISDIRCKM
jgi:hypothetical protein